MADALPDPMAVAGKLDRVEATILRRCPTTMVFASRHRMAHGEQQAVERLQRARLIRVLPRTDMKAGAGQMAEIALTEWGRAVLAALNCR